MSHCLLNLGNFNKRIQTERLLEGTVDSVCCTSGKNTFHQKDRIVFKEKFGNVIQNGDLGTIEAIHRVKRCASVRLDSNNALVHVPIKELYRANLGYAITTHSSQGKTFDNAYVFLGGSLSSRELVYVQLTRARNQTKLFCDEPHAGGELETIIRALERSEQKVLAHQLASQKQQQGLVRSLELRKEN